MSLVCGYYSIDVCDTALEGCGACGFITEFGERPLYEDELQIKVDGGNIWCGLRIPFRLRKMSPYYIVKYSKDMIPKRCLWE